MATIPIPHASRAPEKLTGSVVPIAIRPMTFAHAHTWHHYIQPHIRSDAARADRYWQWPLLHSVFPLAQRLKGYRCTGMTTLVPNQDGDAVPVAMNLLIERYPHLPAGTDTEAVFVWFLCTAPTSALIAMNVHTRPSLGRVCLDTAMVTSNNLDLGGRIGLYSAKAGGTRLMTYYRKKCKLIQIPRSDPVSVRRANDGHFFYTDEERAALLILEHAPLR